MSYPGYFIDTNLADPATGEPVVPEGITDLLSDGSEGEAQGGCCGGSCCN